MTNTITFTRAQLIAYTERVYNEGWNDGSTERSDDGEHCSLLDQRFAGWNDSQSIRTLVTLTDPSTFLTT